MARKKCQFKKCENLLGPGGANIGYKIDNKVRALKACAECTQKVLYSPRGTWEITADRELKPIPAKPMFFI